VPVPPVYLLNAVKKGTHWRGKRPTPLSHLCSSISLSPGPPPSHLSLLPTLHYFGLFSQSGASYPPIYTHLHGLRISTLNSFVLTPSKPPSMSFPHSFFPPSIFALQSSTLLRSHLRFLSFFLIFCLLDLFAIVLFLFPYSSHSSSGRSGSPFFPTVAPTYPSLIPGLFFLFTSSTFAPPLLLEPLLPVTFTPI